MFNRFQDDRDLKLLVKIQSRSMSDPTLSDNDYKNAMGLVWTRVRNHDTKLVLRSCTTKLGVVQNRARQKSCTTKIVQDLVFAPKKFSLIGLKYANFTNLKHLESILINLCFY